MPGPRLLSQEARNSCPVSCAGRTFWQGNRLRRQRTKKPSDARPAPAHSTAEQTSNSSPARLAGPALPAILVGRLLAEKSRTTRHLFDRVVCRDLEKFRRWFTDLDVHE